MVGTMVGTPDPEEPEGSGDQICQRRSWRVGNIVGQMVAILDQNGEVIGLELEVPGLYDDKMATCLEIIVQALSRGVPLIHIVATFAGIRSEPAGMTDDPDLRFASSIIDYLMRRVALDHLSLAERAPLGILTTSERLNPQFPSEGTDEKQVPDAPYCYQCGVSMQPAGECFVCPQCGTTSGCS